jgi:diguanylate cyclase (GGDEF)-like protein
VDLQHFRRFRSNVPPARGEPPFVSAAERPPRLVLRFALCTALGVAAAAAVILLVVRFTDTARAQGQATDRAQLAARVVFGAELRSADLSAPPSARRRLTLDRLFTRRLLAEGIHAAALYGPTGRPLYATRGAAVGPSTRGRAREALSGTMVSEIATVGGVKILRTYVPIALASGEVAGVARLDQQYEPIAAAVGRSSWLIAGVLEALLLLLFLMLLPLLTRVSSRFREHVAELERVATRDELTGLPNRHGFIQAAEHELPAARSAAAVLVDLDGFSEINNSLGSASGDTLLVEAGARLETALPDAAVVARLGEDEFGFMLCDVGRAQLEAVFERVQTAFTEPFVVDGVRVAVSLSIGAAMMPEHGPDLDTVLRRASTSLTAAKVADQDNVQIYRPEHGAGDMRRLAVVAELRDALAAGELEVHYQPQADLLTQRIRGVEALLRWSHPEQGLLAATEFIEHAERNGVAKDIRRFVFESSGRQWQEWHADGLELELSVNLGTVDMLDSSLPDEVQSLLTRYGIPPWNLILEITERTLIGDERRTSQVVAGLHRIGVRLAVDDFGTGYSSLASLRRFPIQQVKLDRSLLAGVPGDKSAEAIVGGSVEIAHGLGATVVAEGIETRDQWRFVYMMGCDIAQGYLIGKAVPADALLGLLDAPRLIPLAAA